LSTRASPNWVGYGPGKSKRQRILDHVDIRVLRVAADDVGYGGLIKLLLLTAQRREKVVTMRRSDIREGIWNIPTDLGEKANAENPAASERGARIINAQPAIADNSYVFAVTTKHYSFSQRKEELDERLRQPLPDMPQWQLHDPRRTAKTLMGQAGVRPDISERGLGGGGL
jgi:integrase